MPTAHNGWHDIHPVPVPLPVQTVAWLAHRPRERRLIHSIWDTLTELEHAGHHPGPIAALRSILSRHQPTPAGQCHACRRSTWRQLWRRRPFPCTVWHQIRCHLLGVFASNGRHRPSVTATRSKTISSSIEFPVDRQASDRILTNRTFTAPARE